MGPGQELSGLKRPLGLLMNIQTVCGEGILPELEIKRFIPQVEFGPLPPGIHK